MSVDKGALRELIAWNFKARQDAELREAGLLPVRKPMGRALEHLPVGSPIYQRKQRELNGLVLIPGKRVG